jgi:ribosomal-protein-alanine N-acetyltransferase
MSQPNLGIRTLRPADLDDVMLIERKSFSTPWTEATFRGLMRRPSAALVVAELDDAVVGYLVMWFVAKEAEIGDIAVLPELRRQGIGRALLQRAIEEARSRLASGIVLEVRASNEGARLMYGEAGFMVVGSRPEYYTEPPEDAYVMRLNVTPATR